MAMNKIERIDREIQKTREKITELNAMLKDGGIPGMTAADTAEAADYEEQEDTEHEE